MPQRKNVKKVTTVTLQGEESYVVYTPMKVGEVRTVRKLSEENPKYDAFEGGLAMLAAHIKDWNWVDEEGSPLAKPGEDASVLDKLTSEEVEFLSDLLLGKGDDLKN